ncbi:MAG: diguanylate cyclase [Candidatus Ozemobacteraceae bacterium]
MSRPTFRLGIRAKLALAIFLIALLPLGFLGWQAVSDQKRIIREEVKRSHAELSNMLAYGIYQNLEFTRRLLTAISELEVIKGLNAVVAEDFFKALVKQYPFFKLIYLVNGERLILASTDPNVTLASDWNFTNAVKRSYAGSLSDVLKTPDGSPYITLESVIKSREKGVIGVLVSEVDLNYIRDLLRDALKRSKSQGMVVDENGAVIARSSSDTSAIGISVSDSQDKDINNVSDIDGMSYLITAVTLKKFDFYLAPNWTIVLQIPEATAFQAAYELRDRILRLFGITALAAILLAVLLSNSFIAPLLNLIDGARHLGKGDFDREVLATTTDEIGELTQTFDEMRVNLKLTKADLDYRILQLSTLFEVGKAISSVLDFHTLQNMILETVVKVMHAEKGSLMLLDDAEKMLSIGVAYGLSDDIMKETRVGVGEPVAGWVIETGQPLFVEDVESDHAFIAIKKSNIMRGTMMSVPLKAKEKLLGVLNLSRPIPGSFSQKDFELFKNLANQAAIAIENARLYRYAVTDEMTKIYNHRYFQQRLDEELQRADRYESQVSLIMLDVDHFKKFNDTYGHPEGDRVLKTVSKLIEKSVREVDIVARYGGEEFVVICPEKDGEGALTPSNRIRTTIENFDFRINGERVPITVSLGTAAYPEQARSKSELVVFADTALYYSKESGRNRATLYSPGMRTEDALKHKAAKKDKDKAKVVETTPADANTAPAVTETTPQAVTPAVAAVPVSVTASADSTSVAPAIPSVVPASPATVAPEAKG